MTGSSRTYKTGEDFRKALEARLMGQSREQKIPLDRLRRQIAFDRLLARMFDPTFKKPMWLLKGGYAMEFRLPAIARSTKDIDFSISPIPERDAQKVRAFLQADAGKDTGDWFSFAIGMPSELSQVVYEGWRFPVKAMMAGKKFTEFHLDISVGDAVLSEPEWVKGLGTLDFAGIPAVRVALFPRDQQFAEKMHSFTFPPEQREFSRVKDMVDLVLLIENGMPLDKDVREALKATFAQRKTHPLPEQLPVTLPEISTKYGKMAEECGVKAKSVSEASELLKKYWNKLWRGERHEA